MATTLSQWEAGPFNAGVNRSMLPSDIDDGEAVVIQDMFLDVPGEIYTRGQVVNVVQNTSTFNTSNNILRGFFSTAAPDGNTHLASVTQDTTGTNLFFTALSDSGNAPGISIALDVAFPLTSNCVVDAKPALGGGLWIGTQELPTSPNIAGRQTLFHWRGATKAAYTTGTVSVAPGSTTVVGVGTSWLANAAPGMFLIYGIGNSLLAGVVKSVDTNTQLTLEFPVPGTVTAGATYLLNSIRSFGLVAAKGRISTTTSSTTVIGSGTKFLAGSMNLMSLFRSKDNAAIGKINAVSGDEGATLVSNALIALDNEPFYGTLGNGNGYNTYLLPSANNVSGTYFSFQVPGPKNCTYAQLQWFARLDAPPNVGPGDPHSRVWFSDYRNMESIDMVSQDGDFINVPSTVGQNRPIQGLAATANALLIFKDNETFAITGNDPDSFNLVKLWDDGCLSPGSIVQYKGTVIWAGLNGIYLYDGTAVKNLVSRSLGVNWANYVQDFDSRVHKMTAAAYKDHYFLTVNTNGTTGNGVGLYFTGKNGSTSRQSNATLDIFLPTGALAFQINPRLLGYARLNQSTLYVTYNGGSAGSVYVCDFGTLFLNAGGKDFPDNASAPFNPDPYVELKRFSMGDPLRQKSFKQVIGTFDANNTVRVEINPGLKDLSSYVLITPTFPATSGTVSTSRVKFLKRERHLGLKFYSSNTASFANFVLRRIAVGYKWSKVGRI